MSEELNYTLSIIAILLGLFGFIFGIWALIKTYENSSRIGESTIVIENVIDKAKDCLDNKYNFSDTDSDSDDENNKCKLKLDLYNEDDMKIVKAVINYDIEDKYKITDSEITDLEGEELEKSSIIYAYDYFTKTYYLNFVLQPCIEIFLYKYKKM